MCASVLCSPYCGIMIQQKASTCVAGNIRRAKRAEISTLMCNIFSRFFTTCNTREGKRRPESSAQAQRSPLLNCNPPNIETHWIAEQHTVGNHTMLGFTSKQREYETRRQHAHVCVEASSFINYKVEKHKG